MTMTHGSIFNFDIGGRLVVLRTKQKLILRIKVDSFSKGKTEKEYEAFSHLFNVNNSTLVID